MIKELQGLHRFLSNFWQLETPYEYEGIKYPTVEHFYVAMKTDRVDIRNVVATAQTPAIAKRWGKTIPIRHDFDDIKESVMLEALRYKFSIANPSLRRKLLQTGYEDIQEGNRWGDKFWGVCLKTGEGDNRLGKLLMQVRAEIQLGVG